MDEQTKVSEGSSYIARTQVADFRVRLLIMCSAAPHGAELRIQPKPVELQQRW